MKIFTTIVSPIGILAIAADGEYLTNLVFGTCVPDAQKGSSSVLDNAVSQLNEYFAGTRKSFDLPLKFDGTEFQNRVWRELQNIPYGKTISYKELAEKTGNIKACRAVGMANNKNPLPIIIPCHRVVGSNGKLTGYAGGLEVKKFLLELEQEYK
ncbi:MAG: methylated-DNA--[Oscillospiraceae bacterium]|nr:methylated-DNA--[protein]-cysteine S-methyltransferase [Oscillospiraceae bacterium]